MSFYGYIARLQESKLRWIVVGACIFGIIAFATMKHQAGYVLCGMIVLLGLNIALRLWKVPDSYKQSPFLARDPDRRDPNTQQSISIQASALNHKEVSGRHEVPARPYTPASAELQWPMTSTDFFHCDGCLLECRVDAEVTAPDDGTITIRHCKDCKGVTIVGRLIRFQERRGGVWVDVQRWIDVA
jgi:hypothetical protein